MHYVHGVLFLFLHQSKLTFSFMNFLLLMTVSLMHFKLCTVIITEQVRPAEP